MSIFGDILSSGVDKVVDSVGNAIDKLVTSNEEKLQLKNELTNIEVQAKLATQKQANDAEVALEKEITNRWEADSTSDDPLAKKVRPFALVYLLLATTFIIFIDSTTYFDFDVKEVYVDLVQALLLLVFGAYFGGRTLEKVMNRKK